MDSTMGCRWVKVGICKGINLSRLAFQRCRGTPDCQKGEEIAQQSPIDQVKSEGMLYSSTEGFGRGDVNRAAENRNRSTSATSPCSCASRARGSRALEQMEHPPR